ncbi:MAG: protein translocase subunit SecF [Bifidobacteriaceae bacterium]|jgi:preprotein translocase subunit SecF|nr:protein translocase subunit SecF [Bifidobacteriaceae bacterium]
MASLLDRWGNNLYTGQKSYQIVQKRKFFYIVSAVAIVICVGLMVFRGFNLGIEFRGGSEFQINQVSNSSQQFAVETLQKVLPNEVPRVSNLGSDSIRIQTDSLDEETQIKVRNALAEAYFGNCEKSESEKDEAKKTEEKSQDSKNEEDKSKTADDKTAEDKEKCLKENRDKVSNTTIGPSWGKDVSNKGITALIIFMLCCMAFMTIYFRNWRMALSGILALFQDLIITVGIYAAVGWEITPASMIGFLTILGYSMYDTVVVFDKVRENTADVYKQTRTSFAAQANLAVNQTFVRSINTTVVALLPVSAVLFIGTAWVGAGTLQDISLALFIGMTAGAYSSIFLATPMLVTLQSKSKKDIEHKKQLDEAYNKLKDIIGEEEAKKQSQLRDISAQLLPGHRLDNKVQPKRKRKKR